MKKIGDKEGLIGLRREQIARHAVQLLVKYGYYRMSVRLLAKSCGIGIGTLYHYFNSKDDIIKLGLEYGTSGYREFFQQIFNCLSLPNATIALKRAIEFFLRTIDQYQDFTVVGYQEVKNYPPELRKSTLDFSTNAVTAFKQVLEYGCSTGEFKIDDSDVVAHNIVVICEMWALRRWYLRDRNNLQNYIDKETAFILSAIVNRKA
jgi:AcrR family transcriptional regulator